MAKSSLVANARTVAQSLPRRCRHPLASPPPCFRRAHIWGPAIAPPTAPPNAPSTRRHRTMATSPASRRFALDIKYTARCRPCAPSDSAKATAALARGLTIEIPLPSRGDGSRLSGRRPMIVPRLPAASMAMLSRRGHLGSRCFITIPTRHYRNSATAFVPRRKACAPA